MNDERDAATPDPAPDAAAAETETEVSFRLPSDGAALPNDLVDFVWQYMNLSFQLLVGGPDRPRSKRQLRELVRTAFQASLHTEEGRQTQFRVLFDIFPQQVTIPFGTPLPYTVGNLVKLAPTIGLGFRRIVVAPRDPVRGPLRVFGICDPDLSPTRTRVATRNRWGEGLWYGLAEVDGLTVAVLGPGHVRVDAFTFRCDLQGGSIRLPIPLGVVRSARDWFLEAGALLGPDAMRMHDAFVRRTWAGVLQRVCDARHGGCFLVLPAGQDERKLPLKLKYPLDSALLRNCLRDRVSVEPGLCGHQRGEADVPVSVLDDAPVLERSLSRVADMLAGLAAVDGAVVLRRDLQIIGFGAEIVDCDVGEGASIVRFSPNPFWKGLPVVKRPVQDFGMRHRSAIRFCQAVPGAVAFVVSQDGQLRVFSVREGQVRAVDVVPDIRFP